MTAQQDDNYDELIDLQEASSYSGLAAASLKDYASDGRLKAQKKGGVWLTTRRWVDEYKANRSARGRKGPE